MYDIGTVARLAQVSIRTLRHYDEIGLLEPAEVDPRNGRRRYSPPQLHSLHRILVLRDLGVPLAGITELLAGDVSVEQMKGILRLRRAEADSRLKAQEHQLARVEARLAQLEEQALTSYEIILKRVDEVRVIALSADLADYTEIPEAAGRLYPRLHDALRRHRVPFDGVSYAFYEQLDDSERPLRITVGLPVDESVAVDDDGIDTIDVPSLDRTATTMVKGAPTQFPYAFAAIHDWLRQTGEEATRFEREVYIDCDGPRDSWVTELQVVLESSARS